MKNAYECLAVALEEQQQKEMPKALCPDAYMLGGLTHLAATLIEGSKDDKKWARSKLQKLIGRGRCIFNAADRAAREKEKTTAPTADHQKASV